MSKPILHCYFRSSCSARIRTACNLKGIDLSYEYINLLANEQFTSEYKATNPSATVPTLTIPSSSPLNESASPIVIHQSIAILEFLEEFPGYADTPRLLPADPVDRARVRELVNIICCDVQPASNMYILRRVDSINGDRVLWAREVMSRGLTGYEELLGTYAGRYSFSDEITMADVLLAPAIEGALRWGVELERFPRIKKVYDAIRVLDAFVKGDWKHQEDTPYEFRV